MIGAKVRPGFCCFRSITPSGKVKNPKAAREVGLKGLGAIAFTLEEFEMFAPNPSRRLRETIFLGGVVIGAAALGAVVLYAATSWLWLVVHQGLH